MRIYSIGELAKPSEGFQLELLDIMIRQSLLNELSITKVINNQRQLSNHQVK
jgi:hypothetical protein